MVFSDGECGNTGPAALGNGDVLINSGSDSDSVRRDVGVTAQDEGLANVKR
jgi:hypothetical protein